jgi:hypothetical protein
MDAKTGDQDEEQNQLVGPAIGKCTKEMWLQTF